MYDQVEHLTATSSGNIETYFKEKIIKSQFDCIELIYYGRICKQRKKIKFI